MACMKLGSKSDVFSLDGHSWFCSTGLPSDVIVEVGDTSFHLHKFPLLSRSKLLQKLIGEFSGEDGKKCLLQLHEMPGGAKSFLLVAKFCYDVKLQVTAMSIVGLRCAAEYLQMTEDYGEGNLIAQTESFLNEILGNWTDSLKALEACEEVMSYAEELHIVSRCINSLATKASADPSLFSWPMSGCCDFQDPKGTVFWNGICTLTKPHSMGEDWWYRDASSLRLPMYKRVILAVGSNGMKPERVAGAIMHYAMRHLPLLGRQSSLQSSEYPATVLTKSPSLDGDQRNLLEELVELIPYQKSIVPSKFLLRLLRTAMMLHASSSCRENLEKRVGVQLHETAVEDLLIPNTAYSMETLYDIDCVQRILDHFMLVDQDAITSNDALDEGSHSLTPVTLVANLIDNYLAEVAPDINLKLAKFQSLAAAIPDYARTIDDGLYRAIDIYLKAHPWLIDFEREQLCRLMNCQKLSLEASTHAAQNERLPLRVIVQVLFFEQLRLRTSLAGWFFVSDSLENSQNFTANLALARSDVHAHVGASQDRSKAVDDMKDRVSELEKECLSMKEEIDKLVKTKGIWNLLFKRFTFTRSKPKSVGTKPQNPKDLTGSPSSTAPLLNDTENRNSEE
ncbi:hypothetical protein K2173_004153 [Erythroxylum novogranatense]|uniref:BTB/POZ domain-containing protein At5g03250-like n=1 Tax=Erythroxylum novogranatense TaxID=1862640 RepID=A0AAV8SXF6_9ROSI|nr:hypothetical protein K2173_004153 [Erythroxylum novogranatense]